MTERKPTNDNILIQTNNSYDITYGLKKDVWTVEWSEQVAGKSVYAVWDYNIVMQWTLDNGRSSECKMWLENVEVFVNSSSSADEQLSTIPRRTESLMAQVASAVTAVTVPVFQIGIGYFRNKYGSYTWSRYLNVTDGRTGDVTAA